AASDRLIASKNTVADFQAEIAGNCATEGRADGKIAFTQVQAAAAGHGRVVREGAVGDRDGAFCVGADGTAEGDPVYQTAIGRHAYVMEIDTLYCDLLVTRWETFTWTYCPWSGRARE